MNCEYCRRPAHKGECQTGKLTGQEMADAERRFERSRRGWEPMDPGDTRDLWKDGD
jgi:hypothetical protein